MGVIVVCLGILLSIFFFWIFLLADGKQRAPAVCEKKAEPPKNLLSGNSLPYGAIAENGAHEDDALFALKIYRKGCRKQGHCDKSCPLYELCHYRHNVLTPKESAEIFLGGLSTIRRMEQ